MIKACFIFFYNKITNLVISCQTKLSKLLKFIKLFLIRRNLSFKRNFFIFTGFSWNDLQYAILVSALLILILKSFNYLFFGIPLFPLFNLFLSFLFSLLALKLNLIFYIRENLVKLLEKTIGEKIKFEEAFVNIYIEYDSFAPDVVYKGEDSWYKKQYKLTDNRSIMQKYQKNPDYTYSFIPPTENFFNLFIREFCIFLVQLRLFILQIPLLFRILKFLLVYLFIFNKLTLLSYIMSILIIFSKIIFYITDFTQEKMNQSYIHLNETFWVETEIETLKVYPNRKNAIVLFIWSLRSFIDYNYREKCNKNNEYRNKKKNIFDFTGIFIYDKLMNLNYLDKEQKMYNFIMIEFKKINLLYIYVIIIIMIGIINKEYFINYIINLEGYEEIAKNASKGIIGSKIITVASEKITHTASKVVSSNSQVITRVNDSTTNIEPITEENNIRKIISPECMGTIFNKLDPKLALNDKIATSMGLGRRPHVGRAFFNDKHELEILLQTTIFPGGNRPAAFHQQEFNNDGTVEYGITGTQKVIRKINEKQRAEIKNLMNKDKFPSPVREKMNDEIYLFAKIDHLLDSSLRIENGGFFTSKNHPACQLPLTLLPSSNVLAYLGIPQHLKVETCISNIKHLEFLISINKEDKLIQKQLYEQIELNKQFLAILDRPNYWYNTDNPHIDLPLDPIVSHFHKATKLLETSKIKNMNEYEIFVRDNKILTDKQPIFGITSNKFVKETSQKYKSENEVLYDAYEKIKERQALFKQQQRMIKELQESESKNSNEN